MSEERKPDELTFLHESASYGHTSRDGRRSFCGGEPAVDG